MVVLETINVGLAEIRFSKNEEHLKCIGLGSCVGVVIYHPKTLTAIMAHVMLPDSAASRTADYSLGKFADTAIKAMTDWFRKERLSISELEAKIAGGSEMFKASGARLSGRIGPRNVEAVKEHLSLYNIKLIAEDTGGHYGRTIEFDNESHGLHIRTIHLGEKTI
jgi:chemotaxis protein CheD